MNFLKVFLLIFAVPVVLTAQEMGFSWSEEIEGDYHPHYLISATGDFKNLKRRSKRRRHFWPVTLSSIGHTMASYQRYDFVGGAYFHHGIDIRAEAGSDVLAAAGGRVINVENYFPGDDAYWEVAILDEEGFIWQYHHIERESIPKEIFEAYQAKIPIEAGTKLGEVYFWKIVTFGERFHHIHLNVLGKNKEYLNPFEFLEILPDSVGPEIGELFLIQNKQVVSGNTVSSDKYTIAAEFKDWILSDVFVVPPNEVKISIDGQNPTSIWKFETLPGGADNKAFVNQFYVPEKACGDYSCRKPVIDLGFSKQGGQLFPLSSGKHQLQVWAFDYNGNYVSRKFDWVVK